MTAVAISAYRTAHYQAQVRSSCSIGIHKTEESCICNGSDLVLHNFLMHENHTTPHAHIEY